MFKFLIGTLVMIVANAAFVLIGNTTIGSWVYLIIVLLAHICFNSSRTEDDKRSFAKYYIGMLVGFIVSVAVVYALAHSGIYKSEFTLRYMIFGNGFILFCFLAEFGIGKKRRNR